MSVVDPIESGSTGTPGGPETPPKGPAESRQERSQRHQRRARLYLWAALGVLVVGLIIAWVVKNRETVEVDWVLGSTDAALALVIFVAAALGWVVGIATAALIRRRTRPPEKPRKKR